MRYSYFTGCQIPARLTYCDLAVRNVTHALGIALHDLQDVGCCGYPIRFIDADANMVLSTRILAHAARANLDLMVLCNSCYSSLLKAQHLLMVGRLRNSKQRRSALLLQTLFFLKGRRV